jgi:hypothetical protein
VRVSVKILASIFILFLGYNLAPACSCLESTDELRAEALQNASVIFYGKVISTDNSSEEKPFSKIKVSFHVLKAWKGVETNEIVITTASETSACGYPFRKDETLTVYAFGNPPNTSSCSMQLVDEKRVREVFGEGQSFEELPPPQTEAEESFWSRLWRKITSIFS